MTHAVQPRVSPPSDIPHRRGYGSVAYLTPIVSQIMARGKGKTFATIGSGTCWGAGKAWPSRPHYHRALINHFRNRIVATTGRPHVFLLLLNENGAYSRRVQVAPKSQI